MARKYRKKRRNGITLIVSGEKFMANKVIISKKSDYFKAMFSSGMLESKSNQVEIKEISSKVFADVLYFMHGLELEICMENVLDFLAIADYFQIKDAFKACEKFLMSNVDVKNCRTFANIAECYSFVGLKKHVLNFIDENLWDISKTKFFYKLTPEQIHHAVTADKIINFSELDLLEAILQWGLKPSNLTIEDKLKHVEAMLGHVRFYEISKKELNERLMMIFSENSAIHLIHEKIRQLSMLPCNSLRTKFSTRGLKKAILRVCEDDDDGREKVLFNFINDTKWIKLTKIPILNNCDELFNVHYTSVVVNNELYTIADCDNSFVVKFSPKTNNWEITKCMNMKRCLYSICEAGDKIYAVGGYIFKPGQESSDVLRPTNTAESYNPIMKTWEYIKSLPQARSQHASVNFANILYISGGFINGLRIPSASMMKYNPLFNSWLSCAPLLSSRAHHTMITYGDKIYACGGRGFDSFGLLGMENRNIEEYDVANDSWRILTTVPGRSSRLGEVIFVESKIYILPHYCYTEIDCYDVETNEWSKELKENKDFEDNYEYEYHTMYLPKSLAGDD